MKQSSFSLDSTPIFWLATYAGYYLLATFSLDFTVDINGESLKHTNAKNVCFYYRLMISDINECKKGTHNCSSNAVCNNTKGSYNCTCKPGYEGDGNNCTGNFFLNLIILYAFESIAVFIFP